MKSNVLVETALERVGGVAQPLQLRIKVRGGLPFSQSTFIKPSPPRGRENQENQSKKN